MYSTSVCPTIHCYKSGTLEEEKNNYFFVKIVTLIFLLIRSVEKLLILILLKENKLARRVNNLAVKNRDEL